MPSYTPAMAPQTPNNIVVQTRLRLMPQARGPRPQQYGIVAALQPKAEGCTSRRQSNGPGQPQAPATAQNRQGRPRARHKQKKASRNHIGGCGLPMVCLRAGSGGLPLERILYVRPPATLWQRPRQASPQQLRARSLRRRSRARFCGWPACGRTPPWNRR